MSHRKSLFCFALGATALSSAHAATVTTIAPTVGNQFGPISIADLAGLGFDPIRTTIIDFDVDGGGAPIGDDVPLVNQYAALGLTISGSRSDDDSFGGPASLPNNAIGVDDTAVQRFFFDVPVTRVGLINLSPDGGELYEVFGPGNVLLGSFVGPNQPNRDQFVRFDALAGEIITELRLTNIPSQTQTPLNFEVDDLVFEVNPIPIPGAFFPMLTGLLAAGGLRRMLKS